MRNVIFPCALLILGFVSLTTAAEIAAPEKPSPEQIKAWRKEGPAAVDRLMREREKLIATAKDAPGKPQTFAQTVLEQTAEQRAAWARVYALNNTIDEVAAARYSHESGLYWYTDEAEAQRIAKEQGKPLLALRLLGNLNEELSCANSRYFRILLYPDDKVRQLLHDQFILTWKSVRAVPKITIDLGEGRKVERSITGNSVHYVVLPNGMEVLDVFPGLYGPKPFYERLAIAQAASQKAIRSTEVDAVVKEYHALRIQELEACWKADVAKYEELQRRPRKAEVESKYVGWVEKRPQTFWEVAADFHPEYAELGQTSLHLIQHEAMLAYYGEIYEGQKPIATKYGERIIPLMSFSKGGDERVFQQLLDCVQPALRADTLHNEYAGRYFGLRYLLGEQRYDRNREGNYSIDELNEAVYSQIFGYPPGDPWAGLSQLNSLTALPKDRGLKQAERKE